MEGVIETRGGGALSSFLAGLQAGMMGILAMLVWLGISAAWQQRSFWTSENLMASLFYGNRAIRTGFAGQTLSGLAVYLVLYSLLGGALAWVLRDRVPRLRVLMLSVLFALAWYYFSYRLLWTAVAPLIALLHVQRANVLGHLVYGTLLARYPLYLPQPARPPVEEAPSEATAEIRPAEEMPGEPAPPEAAVEAASSAETPGQPAAGGEPDLGTR